MTDERRYLPRPVLEYLAVRLKISLAEILRVASFYNAFSLTPVGRHTIEICLGTACFVRGSGLLLERLEQEIGVTAGRNRFSRAVHPPHRPLHRLLRVGPRHAHRRGHVR